MICDIGTARIRAWVLSNSEYSGSNTGRLIPSTYSEKTESGQKPIGMCLTRKLGLNRLIASNKFGTLAAASSSEPRYLRAADDPALGAATTVIGLSDLTLV